MDTERKTIVLRWISRTLAIMFIVFVSLFALDVFGQETWFVALLIHLIPTFILIIITIIAWKKEFFGGLLFIVVGLVFVFMSNFQGEVLYVPAILVGLLFLLSYKVNHRFIK